MPLPLIPIVLGVTGLMSYKHKKKTGHWPLMGPGSMFDGGAQPGRSVTKYVTVKGDNLTGVYKRFGFPPNSLEAFKKANGNSMTFYSTIGKAINLPPGARDNLGPIAGAAGRAS